MQYSSVKDRTRLSKQIGILLLSMMVLFSGFVIAPPSGDSEVAFAAAPSLVVGDYVQFGTYNSEPILWRVINKDGSGNPLLFTDRIITAKAFDAAGPYYTSFMNMRNS